MDKVKPGARRAIDGLVLIFGRVITILQPVLDPLVGVRTGENDWAAHRAILGRPSLLGVVQSQLGCAAYASAAKSKFFPQPGGERKSMVRWVIECGQTRRKVFEPGGDSSV